MRSPAGLLPLPSVSLSLPLHRREDEEASPPDSDHSDHYFHQQQEVTIPVEKLTQGASRANILHHNGYSAHSLCRQMVDGSDHQIPGEVWSTQLPAGGAVVVGGGSEQPTEEDRNLNAAIVQFLQREAGLGNITKADSERSDSDESIQLFENAFKLNHGTQLEETTLPEIELEDKSLQVLPSLPSLKKPQNILWYHQKSIKGDINVRSLEQDGCQVDMGAGSLVQSKQHQNRKSLPHKKRISKKLKKITVNGSQILNEHDVIHDAQHSIDMIQEEVPDDIHPAADHSFSAGSLVNPTMHSNRGVFICQLCGDFYEDQLKFFYHLKHHYEPLNGAIMLDNMQHDDSSIALDKMDESMVVSNDPLPVSLVDLSFNDAVASKSLLYSSANKIAEYDDTAKSIYNVSLKSSIYADQDKAQLHQDSGKFDDYISDSSVEKLAYSCDQCPKTFKRQKHYEHHMKELHSKTEEMSEFSEPEDLMEGINVVVEPENEEYLQEDLSSQHSNTIIIQTIDNRSQYILPHLTIDNGQIISQSDLEFKEWYIKGNVNNEEMRTENPPSPPKCDMLEKENLLSEVVEDDKSESVSSDDLIVCPVCGGVLSNRKEYDSHIGHCHIDLKDEVKHMMSSEVYVSDVEPGEIGPFNETELGEESEETEETEDAMPKKTPSVQCLICGRQFKHKNSVLYHMISHDGIKSFQCEVCNKSFYTASALKVHKRLHSGDKPYICMECGRKFRQWGDLKYHFVSIHSDIKQHQCEYCGKNFARKYSLIIHRRIHTGEKNYKCEFCDKTFRASSYLQNHRKIHTGEKPYPCEHCGKRFRMRGDMRRHLRIHNRANDDKADIKASNSDESLPAATKTTAGKSKPSYATNPNESKVMKMEKEEVNAEDGENEDSSSDVKQTVSAVMDSVPLLAEGELQQEDSKVGSNFPMENNGAVYMWPVYIA